MCLLHVFLWKMNYITFTLYFCYGPYEKLKMAICLIRVCAILYGKQVPFTMIPSFSQNEMYFGKILLKVKLKYFYFLIPQAQILQFMITHHNLDLYE